IGTQSRNYTGHVLVVLPKADLLAPTPSVARRTVLDILSDIWPVRTGVWPFPVLDLDNAGSPEILLSANSPYFSPYPFGVFKRSDIIGPITSPTLDLGT